MVKKDKPAGLNVRVLADDAYTVLQNQESELIASLYIYMGL